MTGVTGDGLIYTENAVTNSKTVYASFGLEALSTDYYLWYQDNPGLSIPQFSPHNKRQNILHNIVDYLRTGTITGRVVQTATARRRPPAVPAPPCTSPAAARATCRAPSSAPHRH